MAGQYQVDVIGVPFSGSPTKNGSMTVMACPRFGSRSVSSSSDSVPVDAMFSQYTEKFGAVVANVVSTANGATLGIYASVDESVLEVNNAGAWSATSVAVEVSYTNDPDSYMALEDSSGAVTFTADGSMKVAGGMYYRMNVTNHAGNDITLRTIGVK